jgi:hypothetical protein
LTRLDVGSGGISSAGGITGTLNTAAQPNITSLGTLTSLTASGLGTFNAGITSNHLYVSNGATFAGTSVHTGLGTFNAGITSTHLHVSNGATFAGTFSGATANFTGLVLSTVGFSGSGTNITGLVASFNGAIGAVLADAVTWSVITADQTAVVNRGYFANKGTRLVITLPTTAAVGSVIRVSGINAGLWKIAQNTSGVIHFGKTDTTVSSGYLESTHARDSVELICCVANNEWNVVSSVGNITIA